MLAFADTGLFDGSRWGTTSTLHPQALVPAASCPYQPGSSCHFPCPHLGTRGLLASLSAQGLPCPAPVLNRGSPMTLQVLKQTETSYSVAARSHPELLPAKANSL